MSKKCLIVFIATIQRVTVSERVNIITDDKGGLTGAWHRAFEKAMNLGLEYEPYTLKELELSPNDVEEA